MTKKEFFEEQKLLLLFLEVLEDGMDVVKGFVDLLADLGARQHHFPGNEDQQNDFRFDHSVDET
jgi:hypothetical protein